MLLRIRATRVACACVIFLSVICPTAVAGDIITSSDARGTVVAGVVVATSFAVTCSTATSSVTSAAAVRFTVASDCTTVGIAVVDIRHTHCVD